jgi:hypothetical protein
MKQLPNSIIILVLYLVILFNVERVTLSENRIIDLSGFVYALVALEIIIIIANPILRRAPLPHLILICDAIYFILKFTIFSKGLPMIGNELYSMLAEVLFITIGLVITHYLAKGLEDFIAAIEKITFTGLRRVREIHEANPDIQTEMYRARRYNHPVTLLVLQPESYPIEVMLERAVVEVQRSMVQRYVSVGLLKKISKQLRMPDLVFDIPERKRFAILYPETDRQISPILVNRINEVSKRDGIRLAYGISSFPDDAVTFEELLAKAESNMIFTIDPTRGPDGQDIVD